MFRGTIDAASIRIWLRDPVPWSKGHAPIWRAAADQAAGDPASGVGPQLLGVLVQRADPVVAGRGAHGGMDRADLVPISGHTGLPTPRRQRAPVGPVPLAPVQAVEAYSIRTLSSRLAQYLCCVLQIDCLQERRYVVAAPEVRENQATEPDRDMSDAWRAVLSLHSDDLGEDDLNDWGDDWAGLEANVEADAAAGTSGSPDSGGRV